MLESPVQIDRCILDLPEASVESHRGEFLKPDSSTQQRILDAAEALFSRQGIAATSLRSITKRADVNAAAIHYHFGSKPALVSAILRERVEPLSNARLEHLERLERKYRNGEIPADRIVDAYVAPLLTGDRELRLGLARLGGFLTWLRIEGDRDAQRLARHVVDVNERFAVALCRGRVLDLEEARDRMNYATGSIVQFLRQEDDGEAVGLRPKEIESLRFRLSHLTRFLAAAFAAPATSDLSGAHIEQATATKVSDIALAAGGRRR